ncbi:MAG: Asp-tRNA(Asn)/Glu-tRNA(Gln) amidotransferase subunit GatA [Myxococcaceae bacterium]|nr:Asp-tRNA(Asn)/Glu-tRNA(Gln) amidotransferase subunit GatA [Myxococcaceae bacterium]MBH2006867.1 Asp-tRNA(Asn)/Glu-tRNA(Gln) amidotransferase subunit GatA [Myxococcaceae bacterium]
MKTLSEAINDLNEKKASSVELTKACLSQIRTHDEQLGCYLHVAEASALKSAQESDARRAQGQTLGALDGIPLGIKDMIFCQGMPVTAASKILENYVAPYDATVIQKLKKQGAILLGKLNQDEFAMGSSGENSAYRICRNPLKPTHTPGGSSSGSAAAVVANMGYGTLGTDTGGSVRQPASYCGIVGLKPTYGRVSRYGVIAYASSLDQVGVLGHGVRDAAHLLQGIAGHDPSDSTSVDLPVPDYASLLTDSMQGLKIGVPKEFFVEGLAPEVRSVLEDTIARLEKSGASLQEISLPNTQHALASYYIIATAEASSNLSRYDGIRYGPRLGEEGGLRSVYEETRGQLFGTEVKRRILLGSYVLSAGYYDAYYVRAQKVRRLIAEDFRQAFQKVDVILGPTAPTPAFKLGEKALDPLQMYLADIFTIPVNLAGLPGISIPGGRSYEGLPIGVQLIGKPFQESDLLNAAYALERLLA